MLFSDVDGGYGNNDEMAKHVDFRKLPSKSSGLRRSYERYRLTRRLGAGKFSDVYEAVDLEWASRIPERDLHQRVGIGRFDGDTTNCSTETEDGTEMEDERIDCDSLVVLKVSCSTLFLSSNK